MLKLSALSKWFSSYLVFGATCRKLRWGGEENHIIQSVKRQVIKQAHNIAKLQQKGI